MSLKTPLYETHQSLGAKIVDFASWQMPLQYSGIMEEHLAVRSSAGLFDIGHMGQIEIDDLSVVQMLTTNDAGRLEVGSAQYSFICAEDGGIIDDLLVYRMENTYLVVTNAVNAQAVFEKFLSKSSSAELLYDSKTAIALQGPDSEKILQTISDSDLSSIKYRQIAPVNILGQACLLSRSGYTGEGGFEIFLGCGGVKEIWDELIKKGVPPCGLGARDTLRIEAGLPLYGHELNRGVTPFEAGLFGAVSFEKKDYTGRRALLERKEKGALKKLAGFEVLDKAIPRQGYKIFFASGDAGLVTSGTFSPTLKKSIGMGYIDAFVHDQSRLNIEIRGNLHPAKIVKLPFYKRSNKTTIIPHRYSLYNCH